MKVSEIEIHNFRSIGSLHLNTKDSVTLLGANNCGKSNVLKALEFALVGSIKPGEKDFFANRQDGDQSLWVEITFRDLTEQEQKTFQKYLRSDGTIKYRKTATLGEDGSSEVCYNGYVQEPQEWWLTEAAFERLSKKDDIASEAESVPELTPLTQQSGKISKAKIEEFQQSYIAANKDQLAFTEKLESGTLLGQKNVVSGTLPEFFLIPAVKELNDETKITSRTTFGRLLLRAINEMAENDERVKKIRTDINTIIDSLNMRTEKEEEKSDLQVLEESISSELKDWKVKVNIEVTPPEVEKLFELGTDLSVDDGHSTTADRKGHGLQRALIFALIRAWANSLRKPQVKEGTKPRKASESVVFAFEEPELFLHPHAQRQLAANLANLADTANHQVFSSTHSTHFVDLDKYRSIVLITKDKKAGTAKRQCECDLFEGESLKAKKDRFHMAYWVNPDRAEMFFARKTILVEGETEKTVLPYLANRLGFMDETVSVVDCGGKSNLLLYIEILNAFGMSYLVVHDEDPVDSNLTGDKLSSAKRTFAMNQTIADAVSRAESKAFMLSPDFEGAAGLKTKNSKKGKALVALERLNEISDNDLSKRIKELVREAYA